LYLKVCCREQIQASMVMFAARVTARMPASARVPAAEILPAAEALRLVSAAIETLRLVRFEQDGAHRAEYGEQGLEVRIPVLMTLGRMFQIESYCIRCGGQFGVPIKLICDDGNNIHWITCSIEKHQIEVIGIGMVR
jgi:hypothetical protein